MSGESIEAYLQNLETAKDFQQITIASTEAKRKADDTVYANNLKEGLEKLKRGALLPLKGTSEI